MLVKEKVVAQKASNDTFQSELCSWTILSNLTSREHPYIHRRNCSHASGGTSPWRVNDPHSPTRSFGPTHRGHLDRSNRAWKSLARGARDPLSKYARHERDDRRRVSGGHSNALAPRRNGNGLSHCWTEEKGGFHDVGLRDRRAIRRRFVFWRLSPCPLFAGSEKGSQAEALQKSNRSRMA